MREEKREGEESGWKLVIFIKRKTLL